MALQRRQGPPRTERYLNARDPHFTYYCAADPDWQLTLFRHLLSQLPRRALQQLAKRLKDGEVWMGGHTMLPTEVDPRPGVMAAWVTDTELEDLHGVWSHGRSVRKRLWEIAKTKYGIEDLAIDAESDEWPGSMHEAQMTSDPEDVLWVVQDLLSEVVR